MNSKLAYSLDEVAELLGVSRASVDRAIRAGKMRVARLGHRTVRVTDEALRDYLKAHEETGPRDRQKGTEGDG